MNALQQIKQMCDGISYTRDVPQSAKELAAENNIIIIVGGSDDLMYCYGAECYLTDECEHSYGWDGDTLQDIEDKQLEREAAQLGLKIFWCGKIKYTDSAIPDYDVDESGAFSYQVNPDIQALDFKVMEDEDSDDVYCTGKIIQLPEGFVSAL